MNQQEQKETLRLLKILQIRMEELMDSSMKDYGLTAAQSNVLEYILDHEKSNPNATGIHQELHLSRSSISVMIKKLREKGLLEIRENPGDDRQKQIIITDKARKISTHMEGRFLSIQNKIYQGITDKELLEAADVLKKMFNNLSRQQKRAEGPQERR